MAARWGSTPHAVGRWRKRFVEHRIADLGDMPRSGGPRTVTDEQVAAVVKRTLESTPKNATHWSTRVMATEMGLSQSTVSRSRRALGLQPHRTAPHRDLQAVHGPVLRREGPRRRRACIWTRPSALWCSASTTSRRSRLWTVPSRCCR
ncbi:helix-turn-helix domain-containing protein [Streptomyces sp. NPDC005931]|uniref:helix-turn-helix domain-containing protein n=1 Tax=Streptomyces sp. NPDC005931 TaxID=3364737 RepID=UPI00369D3B3A